MKCTFREVINDEKPSDISQTAELIAETKDEFHFLCALAEFLQESLSRTSGRAERIFDILIDNSATTSTAKLSPEALKEYKVRVGFEATRTYGGFRG